jgi:hypothetical protein
LDNVNNLLNAPEGWVTPYSQGKILISARVHAYYY